MSASAVHRDPDRGMTKRYRGQTAVDRLTLDVPAGSVFGLLGENGAGKTTTIQSLLGLVVPDAGRVETLGLDPVAAEPGGPPAGRLRPRAAEPLRLDDRRRDRLVRRRVPPRAGVGPAAYQERYQELVAGLRPAGAAASSSSSRRGCGPRSSLALALASDPELLILDEPTSGLDLLVRREFLESMVDLAGEGRTVLLSSHQVAEVERVASHVAILHQGKLLLAEPLDELRAGRSYST